MDEQKNMVTDHKGNLKNHVDQTGAFVCILATHGIIKVTETGVSGELAVKVLMELFGIICSKSSL